MANEITKPNPRVVIEITGGCVSDIYTDLNDVEFVVVDWDNIKNGDAEGRERPYALGLKRMSGDLRDEVEQAFAPDADQPAEDQKLKLITVDLTAMEWRDKTFGNTYFSAQVTVNFGLPDAKTFYMPMQYGSGSCYEFAALSELVKLGYISPEFKARPLGFYCRENLIPYRPNVHENQKQRDVKAFGTEPK